MSNEAILRKADITLADLEADGGLLQPEQANEFIRRLVDQPTILNQARVIRMNSPKRKVNKIGFGSRILRAATSCVPLTEAERSKPTTEQIEMETDEVIAEIRLPYDVIEDNIERGNIGTHTEGGNPETNGGIKDTIMSMIAEQAALDLEELGLLGDTANLSDTYLALTDGWLKNADANVVDLAGAPLDAAAFQLMLKGLPSKYLRNKAAMRHFVSFAQECNYRATLAGRETALGDAQLTQAGPAFAYGVAVEAAAQMPDTDALFTNPLNLLFGIQRNIHIETDKDITARCYIIVLTARVAYQIEEKEAMVHTINIAP